MQQIGCATHTAREGVHLGSTIQRLLHLFPKAEETSGGEGTEGEVFWAIDDSAKRASNAFEMEVEVSGDSSITEALLGWAAEHQLQQIAAMRPEIGPLHDQLGHLQAALSNADIELIFFDRPEDLALRPLATGGFFGFWEKMQKLLEG